MIPSNARRAPRATRAWAAAALAVAGAAAAPWAGLPVPHALAQPPATDTATPGPTNTLPPTETPFVPTATRTSAPPTASAAASATAAPSATAGPTPTATVVRRASDDKPVLALDKVHANPGRPAPGQAFDLEIEVRNLGRTPARNVRVGLSSESFLGEGRSSGIWKDGIAPGEERDFDTRLRAIATLRSGTYPVAVTLDWEDDEGNPYTVDASFGIDVGDGVAARPLVVVRAARLPGRVAPGSPFGATFVLGNTGGREARNVVLVPAGGGPLALHGGGEVAPIALGPGAEAEVTLRLVAGEQAAPGAVSQPMELRYDDPDGQRFTETQPVGVTVVDDAAYGPLPIVAAYRGGDALSPGDVFELSLDVINAGRQDALRTVLAFGGGDTLVPDSTAATSPSLGPFAPLGRGNRVFLDRLAVGETRTVSQRMVVDGAAKPGVYTLDLGFSFADADGRIQAASDVVTLLVSRRAMLEITPLEPITDTVVGQPVPFAVEIINAGTAAVNVGAVELEGDGSLRVEAAPRFIGALDPGAADVVDAQVVPERADDDARLTVRVRYLDDFNQERSVERAIAFRVADAPEPVAEDGAEEASAGRRPLLLRILRGLLGLGASQPAAGPDDALPPGAVPAPIERGAPPAEGEIE